MKIVWYGIGDIIGDIGAAYTSIVKIFLTTIVCSNCAHQSMLIAYRSGSEVFKPSAHVQVQDLTKFLTHYDSPVNSFVDAVLSMGHRLIDDEVLF